MIFQKYKNWIIIGLVIIVAFVIYAVFFGPKEKEEGLLSSGAVKTPAALVGSEIISALNQIESLRLDRAIFDSPVYQSLKDRSRKIQPEPVGKANPFSPIGSSASERNTPEIEDRVKTPATNTNRGPSTITNDSFISPPVI